MQSKGLSRIFSNTTVQNINSSALGFLYGPTLTSIHEDWKNCSFDYIDFCWQTNVHQIGDSIQPSHPLLSPSPPAFNLSQHHSLFNESVLCIRWPKYWSFSFSISPSNEYSGLISFRIDWLDFLAVQDTLKSFLQHHSSKASILLCSAFFIIQLSHPHMTTGKTIALTRQTFVGK